MKKNDKNLMILNTLFVVSLVISNVVTGKLIYTGISIFKDTIVTLPGAGVCYAITFLMTDVIGEIWGKKEANRAVLLGLIGQVFATILIILTQHAKIDRNKPLDENILEADHRLYYGKEHGRDQVVY